MIAPATDQIAATSLLQRFADFKVVFRFEKLEQGSLKFSVSQMKEITGYREKLAGRYQGDVSRDEAAFRWIREFAEGFSAEYLKKLPNPVGTSFRHR